MISEVEITWMLMPFSASVWNICLRDAGMAAHADADDRNLDDVGIGLQSREAETGAALLEHLDGAVEIGLGDGEGQVGRAPSSEMFCTIMSTLIACSASGPKIAAATPGRSATLTSVILASSRL